MRVQLTGETVRIEEKDRDAFSGAVYGGGHGERKRVGINCRTLFLYCLAPITVAREGFFSLYFSFRSQTKDAFSARR